MARGRTLFGSRTSPVIFVRSHHPPKEKNPATTALATALIGKPDFGEANGTKFDQSPTLPANAHTMITDRSPTFKIVSQRTRPAPNFSPATLTAATAAMIATAIAFCPQTPAETKYATYPESPTASAAVNPGSSTRKHFQPYKNASRGPYASLR